MSKKNILCICNTPLQLLNMINVISNYYENDSRDLIITDEIKNCDVLLENIKTTYFFDQVNLINEDYKQTVFLAKGIKKIYEFKKYKTRIKTQYNSTKKYDRIFFWGGGWLNSIVAKQTHKNKNCEFIWIDEGTASYSTHGLYWKKTLLQKIIYHIKPSQIIKKIMGINYLFNNTKIQYLYRPEIADYAVPFKRISIPFLRQNRNDLIKQIFGYDENIAIKEKFIYFDGAGNEDSLYGNDKELLEMVAKIVGKENLLVKVHPRSSSEWYIQNGYSINANTSIPWEVYCFDEKNLRNKVLISIFSTALLSPYLYFNYENKVISLLHLFNKSAYNNYYKYLLDYIEKQIFFSRKDIFLLPNSIEELNSYLI